MRMPFGKYRDEWLEDIPTDYIQWVLAHCENLRPNLRNALEDEMDLRGASYERRSHNESAFNGSAFNGSAATSTSNVPGTLRKWV